MPADRRGSSSILGGPDAIGDARTNPGGRLRDSQESRADRRSGLHATGGHRREVLQAAGLGVDHKAARSRAPQDAPVDAPVAALRNRADRSRGGHLPGDRGAQSTMPIGRRAWLDLRGDRSLDPPVDTGVPVGRAVARALLSVSDWERNRRAALTSAARAKVPLSGTISPKLRRRIQRLRRAGLTLQGIADVLNEEGVPTARGGARWRPSSVQAALGYRRPEPLAIKVPAGSKRASTGVAGQLV
jgi:hypothetical protein